MHYWWRCRHAIIGVMEKYRPIIGQMTFFVIVGVVTLGIDVLMTAFCFYILKFPAYLASSVGFLSGFFFNFPMNRKKVFRHESKDRFSLKTQVFFYISLSLFNLLFTSFVVQILVDVGIAIQYAKVIVTAIIAAWNFVLFKF